MTLSYYHQRYEEILHSNISNYDKNKALSEIMTEMEKEFKIPMLRNEKWEKKNRSVIALYRKISLSRNL